MGNCCRPFLYAIILLLFCRIGTELQHIAKSGPVLDDSVGWMTRTGEEDDSKESSEFEDDDAAGTFESARKASLLATGFGRLESLNVEGHILEVVPPPPKA